MISTRRLLAASLLVSCLLPAPLLAQITTGTVTGSVRDNQGGVVPGALVTLVHAERGTATEATTNAQGDYVFPNLAPGTYTLRIALEGFKTVERPGILVSPGDRVSVPAISIEVGSLSETVTVGCGVARDSGLERRAVVHDQH